MDRNRNIDLLGKKLSIFCRTHIAVGHRIQGGRPGPLRLPSAAAYGATAQKQREELKEKINHERIRGRQREEKKGKRGEMIYPRAYEE